MKEEFLNLLNNQNNFEQFGLMSEKRFGELYERIDTYDHLILYRGL